MNEYGGSAKGLGKLVRYIEVLFHALHYYWAEKIWFVIPRSSLYEGFHSNGKLEDLDSDSLFECVRLS